jgi:hypothetical protein
MQKNSPTRRGQGYQNEFIDYDLYLFTDYISPRKTEVAFRLKENRMNIFSFPDDFRGTPVDHLDPKEYPH